MNVIQRRADRLANFRSSSDRRDDELLNAALDSGQVPTSTGEDGDLLEIHNLCYNNLERKEMEELLGMEDYLLQPHGLVPGVKGEGVTRLLYENPDGLNSNIANNDKLTKAKQYIDDLEADIVAYSEHRQNLRHSQNRNGFRQMFQGGEADVRAVASHNSHEAKERTVGRTQEGGTAMLAIGPITQQLVKDESLGDTPLGRWSSMLFQGSDGVRTRVVCGYNPCYNNRPESGTVYQQHRRYFINEKDDETCPRTKFRSDLISQLQQWRQDGERLVVCLDANENIYTKQIGKELTDCEGLKMVEAVGDFTGRPLGATHFRGSEPIDGVWTTNDVRVVGATVMPVGYGVGDHRLFVIDIATASILGDDPPTNVRPTARRLNTRIPGCAEEYLKTLQPNLVTHRLVERVREAYAAPDPRDVQAQMEIIDNQVKMFRFAAEKRCRRIKLGRIPFSPDAAKWIRRAQVYRSLLKFHAGAGRHREQFCCGKRKKTVRRRGVNRGNLKRTARRAGIQQPFTLTVEEIARRLDICKDKLDYFRKNGKHYRRKHLHTRLEEARKREDEEAEKRILEIITRERDRAFWRRLNFAMGKYKKSLSVRCVQSPDGNGGVREHTTQDDVQQAIFDEVHRKRYNMAEEAPICQGNLRGSFGYTARSPAGTAVLAGTYDGGTDGDWATQALFDEIAKLRSIIPANSVSDLIQGQDWRRKWRRAKEDTSSSESGLHFGHYKASAILESEEAWWMCHFDAMKASLALKRGLYYSRYSRGLSVMLEKEMGVRLVSRLRAILLMEADFNAVNKIIFGNRMLDNLRKYRLMREEIFSERNRMADDGGLTKVLFYDVVRQARMSAAIASVDAANCYDRIAHAMASLVFQACGVPEGAVASMLEAIQNMKFFLRTAFGDSKDFAGSTIELRTQGLCQGNGAAPAGWAVISIVIIRAHEEKGHGANIVAPISGTKLNMSGILFVDDTDLLHVNLSGDETVTEAHNAMQQSIMDWGRLLIATGGALKPPKCFHTLLGFRWGKGKWRYEQYYDNPDAEIVVPMPDGGFVPIEHVPVTEARETLGIFTAPDGSSAGGLKRMQHKADLWLAAAEEAHLHKRMLITSVDRQLWPSAGYGLCCSLASLDELGMVLNGHYYKISPLIGIARTAKRELRTLATGFYGAGLPDPRIHATADQLNKLLMHYGCRSAVGTFLQTSMELLIMELGVSFQPLTESYRLYEGLVTRCWLKSVWEKVDKYGISVRVHNVKLTFGRERDQWLMRRFEAIGYEGEEFRRLNRVRVHQQVLFVSDVLCAGGRYLDPKYLGRRPDGEKWTKLERFPNEHPTAADFRLWQDALRQVAPRGRVSVGLGNFVSSPHKVWDWRMDRDALRLYHYMPGSRQMDVYGPSNVPRHRGPNRYTRILAGVHAEVKGAVCTVDSVAQAVVKVRSTAASFRPAPPPATFLDVLREWECTWLWDDLVLEGDEGWLVEAIMQGTLVGVTDGSYIREFHPDLCSAAFIFECTASKRRLFGSFPEHSASANAFRGELLGLLALHLLLLSLNRVHPQLEGRVTICSDCLGALSRVSDLPPHRIPTRCKHSDILKTLLVNCRDLTFSITYEHIEAHQDDHEDFDNLTRKSQMNCGCDFQAKARLRSVDELSPPSQQPLPLEPLTVYVDGKKMTSDTAPSIHYAAQRANARALFDEYKILDSQSFNEVAWPIVHYTLSDQVPRLFQQWACKQVMRIAGTNDRLHYFDGRSRKCPCCTIVDESSAHILQCEEAGRVEAFFHTADLLEEWLDDNDTDEELADCILQFVRGRGSVSMWEICRGRHGRFAPLGDSQDLIGWQRMLEGMISKEIIDLQRHHMIVTGSRRSVEKWGAGLVTRLLEITHGQWIYRNFVVHDHVSGTLATASKEQLMVEIEEQQELGDDGLLEEDKYLAEVNLDSLESTSGERQTYWLLAMRTARKRFLLRQRTADDSAAASAQP